MKPRIICTIHSMIVIAALLMLLRNTSSSQTFLGIDTLNIKSSKSRSAIVPQADTNVTLKLPKSSGTIALESNGITTAASTGTAISYVADTTIYGGDWVTVAELQVDSGKGGVLEYYFGAYGDNPVRLDFQKAYVASDFIFLNDNADDGVLDEFPGVSAALRGGCAANRNCLNYEPTKGSYVTPFAYRLVFTGDAEIFELGPGYIGRKGIIRVYFSPDVKLGYNTILRDSYELADGTASNHSLWNKRYILSPKTSGRIQLQFVNFRGPLDQGQGTVANCCENVVIDVVTNLRLKNLRLALY
jgi:hypothetical protein